MFLVGLTGGIATGKSTVSQMLSELGCAILDADVIAREVVEPGNPALSKIRVEFGREVILDDGTLNRARLGEIVFGDENKRIVLNSITHPEIYKAMMWAVFRCFVRGEQFVILDLPLLFETKKLLPYLSYVVVVSCESDLQLSRLTSRNDLTEMEALQRINSQLPLAEKCKRATHVIDNSGSRDRTRHQAKALYRELRQSKKHWKLRALVLAGVAALAFVVYKSARWLT